MNKLSPDKRNRILLIVAGALVLAGAFWFLVIRAQDKSLEQYATNMSDLDDKITRARRMIDRKRRLQADLAEQQQKLNAAEVQMIPVEQVAGRKWIFDKLNGFIQRRYDITLTRLSNDPIKGNQFLLLPKLGYSAAAYDIELQAHYHEFSRFLADFENAFPYFSVQKLQMWPLATPGAAAGAAGEIPDEGLGAAEREQLKILIRVVLLFKPAGTT